MFQFLEILMQLLNYIAYGFLVWVLWPLLSAIVALLNAVVHYFTH